MLMKKLTPHGNSVALVLDRAVLDLVGMDADAVLGISTDDGRRLIIQPVNGMDRRARVRDALKRINGKHGKTLKRLAE